MSRRTIYALLCVVVILWGGAFVAIKLLLRDASVWSMAFLRFLLTMVGLFAAVAIVRPPRRPIERIDRPKLLLMGLCGVGAYHLSLYFGERFVSAEVASLVVMSMPVMVAIMAYLLLGEEMSAAKVAGIFLALGGVTVLVLWGSPGGELSIHDIGGAAVTALAPLSWATYTVTSKPLVAKYHPLYLATVALGLGTLMLAPFAIVPTVRDLANLTLADWGWLAFLGLGCSAFAYAVWFYALRKLDASRVAAWVYFVPLTALVWAAILLGERLTPFIVLGGVMVFGGVFLIERVGPRKIAPPRVAETAASEPIP